MNTQVYKYTYPYQKTNIVKFSQGSVYRSFTVQSVHTKCLYSEKGKITFHIYLQFPLTKVPAN